LLEDDVQERAEPIAAATKSGLPSTPQNFCENRFDGEYVDPLG
jgi:hypothetical protein